MIDKALRARLLEMADLDRQVRTRLAEAGTLSQGYDEKMAAIHGENAEVLRRIVAEYGWPGCSLVGSDGEEAAWLVLQHAIGNPGLQRRCLHELRIAVEAGEAPPAQFAYLDDRIRVFEGRPQRYGTQFDWDGAGALTPCPIEEPSRIDELRASVGLGPMAEGIRDMRQRALAEGQRQPADFDAYLRSREAWARSVGWR